MTADGYITLRCGHAIRASAFLGALDMQARGFTLRVEGDGRGSVKPSSRLTETDRRFLAEHSADLRVLIAHEAHEAAQ